MAAEGGLLSYGVDIIDLYRRSAAYVDRIFRGAKPGELPIQAPTGFELVLNLKTAKAMGLEVPARVPAARQRGDRMRRRLACGLNGATLFNARTGR
jgi:ABC-type uncharacterized transport system substrate-binding protein